MPHRSTLPAMSIRLLARLALLFPLGIAPADAAASADAPMVVASIKPLHALVAGVMDGIGTPVLLLPGAASPHDYALRPSDAATIEAARLVFWMGPALEGFLVKPLARLEPSSSIELGERLGPMIRPLRSEPLHEPNEAHDHAAGETAEHAGPSAEGDGLGEAGQDGKAPPDLHAWLDPTVAAAMVDLIADVLEGVDPERAARYRANALAMRSELAALDAELADSLAPVRDRPFIVFHDAYQYFERRYGLRGIGALSVHPEAPPGAKRLAALRERVEQGGAVCVFAEPQFEPKLVRSLIEGTSARAATLDPLGVDLPASAASYGALMRNLAGAFKACLQG